MKIFVERIEKIIIFAALINQTSSYMETTNNKQDIELQQLANEGFAIRPLRQLPQGTYFQLRLNGKIYIRGYYERSSKKYCCICADNANKWRFFPGDKLVAL